MERKADRSPVTQADRMIEERLRRAIHRRLPGESILGEEFGSSDDLGDTYWTIDPIDGTRAFSSGLPSWGIMVGRVERGRATLGVVHYPVFDITLGVAPGVDAYERVGKRQTPLPRARPRHSLQDAVIFHGGLRWWTVPKYVRGFQRIVKASYLERAYGDCYGYLWV
ncbi:MAG: inositol monophosphatase family protein, partial [Candidatus Omnitrophota bacterium]|nr:inositol monophosphatase family protein [Candidatus Omnitrophota bacterium]